eukprot:3981745-Amphidinium_carterae.1
MATDRQGMRSLLPANVLTGLALILCVLAGNGSSTHNAEHAWRGRQHGLSELPRESSASRPQWNTRASTRRPPRPAD